MIFEEKAPSIEKHEHADENSADTRVFTWKFAPDDLKKFIEVFRAYNGRTDSDMSRKILGNGLQTQCAAMLKAKCLPVECMLYASKVSNEHMSDDTVNVIAASIKAVYNGRKQETADVLAHILNSWTWIPQMRITIVAVGLIRERDELFDYMMPLAAIDMLKKSVAWTLMQSKTKANLDRAMSIVIGLRAGSNIDKDIGEMFEKEFSGFTALGIDFLKEYLGDYIKNPDVFNSNFGRGTIKDIMRDLQIEPDEHYIDELAQRSRDDDRAYEEFLSICREKNDENLTFIARFSRKSLIDDFLEPLIRCEGASLSAKNNALISAAQLAYSKGSDKSRYIKRVQDLLREYQQFPEYEYSCLMGLLIINDQHAVGELITLLKQKSSKELFTMYTAMNSATLVKSRNMLPRLQAEIYKALVDTFRRGTVIEMAHLASNLQVFNRRNVEELISVDTVREINKILLEYANNTSLLTNYAAIGLINAGMNFIQSNDFARPEFIKVLFKLYDQRSNFRIRNVAADCLRKMDIDPPTINKG